MKNLIFIVPSLLLLTGCPGGNPAPHTRLTFINGHHICFSTDKKDVLNYFTIYTMENKTITLVVSSGYYKLHSYYPDSCIDVTWEADHSYVIHYGLNNNKYVHQFSIDKNGKRTNLGEL